MRFIFGFSVYSCWVCVAHHRHRPRAPLLRPRRDLPASPPTRRPRAPRRPVRASRRPPVALRRPSSPCFDRDTCIAPARRPRAMRRPIIIVARAPTRPSIHITRLRRVCTAARRSTSSVSSSAASGRLRQTCRLPQLGRRCSVGRSGLAARAPALLWQPGCRC